MTVNAARKVAFDVLRRVERGGFASDLLRESSVGMAARDAGLAQEIVFGCLRRQPQLDFLIHRFTARRLDPEVRIALRMGVYQLRYLDRVPDHAAVGESVQLVKLARKASAAGLVNAVLRKVDREPVPWPERAMEVCLPEWLLEKWISDFGLERANKVAMASLEPARNYVRNGRIQDIGAQSIVPLLELEPGQTFLDLSAAPGNKTAQALETPVDAVACDLKLERLKELKALPCRLVVLDGERPLPFRRRFERILVDAPCSGTGTLRRNPEIRWRVTPSDLAMHHGRQVRMLTNALACLVPGGRLVYSTCSLEVEENEKVIEAVAQRSESREFTVVKTMRRFPGEEEGDGFFAAVITLPLGFRSS